MYFCQNLQSDHLRTSQGQIFLIIPSRSLSQHQKWKSSPIEIDWDLLFHIRKIFFLISVQSDRKVFGYWITLKIEFESLYIVKQKDLTIPMYIFLSRLCLSLFPLSVDNIWSVTWIWRWKDAWKGNRDDSW